MQRDFKTGLAVGLLATTAAAFWLGTRPNLATESRALRSDPAPAYPSPHVSPESPRTTEPVKTSNTVQTARFHVVQKGDTLSALSQKYYGTARYWQKILAANDVVLKDPNRLVPGTRLLIPE